jgi:type IV pilus assembly protein PilM
MADNKSILALNVGSQRVGMARFSGGKGSLVLRGYALSDMPGDPAAEGGKGPQIKEAVQSLARQLKAGKRPIRYVVPGQAVFVRFVKLPPMSSDKLKDIIQFEAVQNVPFPINEVAWDYQLFEQGEEPEVALVAIKSEVLTEINDAVEGNFKTSTVDVAPMALYNAFRFNYPDQSKPSLVIDIGSKSTNLIYVDGDRVFTRNILVGGAGISASIAKEFQIEYPEAEAQKIQNGMVSLGGNYEPHSDPGVEALAQVIRNTMTRVHGEIVRTTNMYRTQQGGNAPEIAYLAGGSATMPYMLEFFKEKLGIDVEYFNALRQVEVSGDSEGAAKDAHALGELVGLALRSAGTCPVAIDLIPESVQKQKALNAKKPFLFTAAACLFGTLLAVMSFFISGKSKADSEKTSLGEEESVLGAIDDEIEKQNKKLEVEAARFAHLQNAVNGRFYWLNMLKELNKIQSIVAGDRMWITHVEPVAENGRAAITSNLFQGGASGRNSGGPQVPPMEDPGRGAPPPDPLVGYVRIKGLYHDTPGAIGYPSAFMAKIVEASQKNEETGVKGLPFFDIDIKQYRADPAAFIDINPGTGGNLIAYPWEILLPLDSEFHRILYPKKAGN